jgi:uncharacterized membrane protein (TIGR02234 family)
VTDRRPLALAVLGCAGGGLLVMLAAGRSWSHTTVMSFGAAQPRQLFVAGHQVAPSLPALGIALLALAGAVIAARGWLRRVVGVLVVFVGALCIGVGVSARGDVSRALQNREHGAQGITVHATANGWWLIAVLGGVLSILAGGATVLRGQAWSAMGSKYDAPAAGARSGPAAPADSDAATWAALDRGEDPTA